jgi:hypothetical protein
MLRDISARLADERNVSHCYNAIESPKQFKYCYDHSNDILMYTTYMIFQGLPNVTYVQFNSTDGYV